jgi:hypothetical protein
VGEVPERGEKDESRKMTDCGPSHGVVVVVMVVVVVWVWVWVVVVMAVNVVDYQFAQEGSACRYTGFLHLCRQGRKIRSRRCRRRRRRRRRHRRRRCSRGSCTTEVTRSPCEVSAVS